MWAWSQKALMPDKPFFMYYAPSATHAPYQEPPEWIEHYRGRFDAGCDALREETFARQKTPGVIPAWVEVADDLKAVLARLKVAMARQHTASRSASSEHSPRLADGEAPGGRQRMAIGLTGEPVQAGSRSGAITHRNDQRSAASQTGTRSSN
jgi:hypothetical protein